MKQLLIHKHFIEKPRFREDNKFAQSHSSGALTQPEAIPKSRAYDIQHRKRIQVGKHGCQGQENTKGICSTDLFFLSGTVETPWNN